MYSNLNDKELMQQLNNLTDILAKYEEGSEKYTIWKAKHVACKREAINRMSNR
ncbi:hypothetical protein [Vibrio breoganii]|uniref:hypothetical protein n=1 Tax=Vibrio breoganii TaxID=553239 RepID=UPI0003000C8B|nr:hypothetical protein [Vibrio breoganii]